MIRIMISGIFFSASRVSNEYTCIFASFLKKKVLPRKPQVLPRVQLFVSGCCMTAAAVQPI